MEDRILATYLLTCAPDEKPEAKALDVAWEETAELPPGSVTPELEERAVGRVEELGPAGDGRWRAVVSYPAGASCGELPQLLNLLWGNVSLKAGIRLEEMALPREVADSLPGPAFGVEGIRSLTGVGDRPLLCGALKPLGCSAAELAAKAGELARGGADLVKDDHSLADQRWAPFRERVRRCRDAVEDANSRRGTRTLYLPNVTGDPLRLAERLDVAEEEGCRGVLLNVAPAGPGALTAVAARRSVFVLAHPTLAGGFLGQEHGIAADVLFGTLFRLGGADAVIYPNVGGRFPFDEEECRAINRRLRGPLGRSRPAFPVPGGGIDVDRISHWVRAYGKDTVFLVGGSLYARPDLEEATRKLVDELERVGSQERGGVHG